MVDKAPNPPSRTSRWVNLTLTLAALALLGIMLFRNREKLAEVARRKPDLGILGAALLFYLMALVVTFFRWYRLVRALDLPFRIRDAIRLGFIGNVFNLVIPGAVGGDVIKAAFLCREQERKTQAVASMVIDRAVGLLGLFVLAGLVGTYSWSTATREIRPYIAAAWILSACGFFGLAILFTPALYRPFGRLLGSGKLATIWNELVAMASAYAKRIGVVIQALAMATSSHALFVVAFAVAARALFHGDAPNLLACFQVVPIVLLSMAIPIPFGALGVSEGLAQAIFATMVGFDGGLVAMLGFRVLMYAGGVISVFVYIANLRQVRSLRQPQHTASEVSRERVA